MAITRLNHAVLYVRDAQRSATFYTDLLGFVPLHEVGPGVFLRAPGSTNDHDLALFSIGAAAGDSEAGRRTVGLYHLAWEVQTLAELESLASRLADAGHLAGASDHGTTKSLYARDHDGLELELVWIVPADLLDDAARAASTTIRPLDLEREQARYGADTKGGIGISIPVSP
jgi:catechol-2,3-dioxygenase